MTGTHVPSSRTTSQDVLICSFGFDKFFEGQEVVVVEAFEFDGHTFACFAFAAQDLT